MKTWEDMDKLLGGYPRVNTATVYKSPEDAEDEKPLDTIQEIIRGQAEFIKDDFEILESIYNDIVKLKNKYKERDVYIRVYPEITTAFIDLTEGKREKVKEFYCRLFFVDKAVLKL